jgi:chromosome segregation ATPase
MFGLIFVWLFSWAAWHAVVIPRRCRAASAALAGRSFVAVVGEQVIVNLPVLSKLRSWSREASRARGSTEDRLRELAKARQDISTSRRQLREVGKDTHIERIEAAERETRAQLAHARRIEGSVTERLRTVEAHVAEVEQRARLEALRHQAERISGSLQTPAAVGATIEVELPDLDHDIEALIAELAEQRKRLAADNEVSAV